MTLFKIWSLCKFFSPLRLFEPQNVTLKLPTVHFLWYHQDPAQDFLIAQIKISVGKGERKDCQSKTMHKLSQVSAYFLHGFCLNHSRMFTQRNKEVENSSTCATCTNSMSNALQLTPSCCSPIWRVKDAHQRWCGLTLWVTKWPLSHCQ